MMIFNIKAVRGITDKANRKTEREAQKEVKAIIRTLKADIKRASKKGVSDFRCKVRNAEAYEKARLYFISKGFRCWKYKSGESAYNQAEYLAIAW